MKKAVVLGMLVLVLVLAAMVSPVLADDPPHGGAIGGLWADTVSYICRDEYGETCAQANWNKCDNYWVRTSYHSGYWYWDWFSGQMLFYPATMEIGLWSDVHWVNGACAADEMTRRHSITEITAGEYSETLGESFGFYFPPFSWDGIAGVPIIVYQAPEGHYQYHILTKNVHLPIMIGGDGTP